MNSTRQTGASAPAAKLCIVTHSYPRFAGDWRSHYIAALARAYARRGAEVTVLVPFTPLSDGRATDLGGIRLISYRYAPLAALHTIGYGHTMRSDLSVSLLDLLLAPLLVAAGCIRLAGLLRRERFDAIHAHWAVPNALIAIGGRWFARSQAKVLTSFPGSDVRILSRLGRIGRSLCRIISRSDYLSCNSTDLKEDLVAAGIPAGRIDLVIYGVDDREVRFTAAGRDALRRSWGAADNDIVLLMIGRFVPKKGFDTACSAMKDITGCRKRTRLVIVGAGPLEKEYRDILERDGTKHAVTFTGEVPSGELNSYYSACDIFLMPSRRLPSDGLNVVVPEAMACGRPVVASRVGGNDLVVFPGVNGFLHDEDDASQLAEFVERLAGDARLREDMGRRGLQLVRERFNWDVIAAHYLEQCGVPAQPAGA